MRATAKAGCCRTILVGPAHFTRLAAHNDDEVHPLLVPHAPSPFQEAQRDAALDNPSPGTDAFSTDDNWLQVL